MCWSKSRIKYPTYQEQQQPFTRPSKLLFLLSSVYGLICILVLLSWHYGLISILVLLSWHYGLISILVLLWCCVTLCLCSQAAWRPRQTTATRGKSRVVTSPLGRWLLTSTAPGLQITPTAHTHTHTTNGEWGEMAGGGTWLIPGANHYHYHLPVQSQVRKEKRQVLMCRWFRRWCFGKGLHSCLKAQLIGNRKWHGQSWSVD